MSIDAWWTTVDNNWFQLKSLIDRFHPSLANTGQKAVISAPDAETRRKAILSIMTIVPVGPELAKQSRDFNEMYKILSETWLGIPESRELIATLQGWNVLCVLLAGVDDDT